VVFNVGVKIVTMCCNNRQPYLHVRFHDQFVMWYQNSYNVYCDGFGGGGAIVWPVWDIVEQLSMLGMMKILRCGCNWNTMS